MDELRDRHLGSLLDAVISVSGDLDLHSTLQRIVAAAAQLVDAKYAALGVVDKYGEGLVDFVAHGLSPDEAAQIGSLPRGHGILGLLVRDPRPMRLHDLREHPEVCGFPEHHPAMTSFLGVPVTVGDRVFGNLYLTDKRNGDDFTDEDELAVIALAAAAGAAVKNARTYHRAQQRAALAGSHRRDPAAAASPRRPEHHAAAGDRAGS